MLLSHISFSLGLIALVGGVCLFLWSVRAEAGPGITLAKVVGIIVIILAVLELLCTVYSGLRMKSFQRELRHYQAPAISQPESSANPVPAESLPVNAPAERSGTE